MININNKLISLTGGNRMFRCWKFIFLVTFTVSILAACNQTTEERASEAIYVAEKAFYANDKLPNETINGVDLYKPARFVISDSKDIQNIVFTKNKESFILFINPNEDKSSRLFYDLLLNDQKKNILQMEAFEDDGEFGFVAILKKDKETFEIVAGVGGAKVSMVTKERKIIEQTSLLMEVVRSIQ